MYTYSSKQGQRYYQNKKGPTPLQEAAAENCPTFGNALTPTCFMESKEQPHSLFSLWYLTDTQWVSLKKKMPSFTKMWSTLRKFVVYVEGTLDPSISWRDIMPTPWGWEGNYA